MHDGVTIKRDSPGSGGDPEASFRLLAETIPEIVFSVTPDGHCDFVNARWTEYTGLPREQAMEYGWLAALHPDDAGACRGRWQAALGRAESVEMECRFRRDDGQHRWFLVRAEPLRDDDGRPGRWLGTCTDIDARRRAEAGAQESEERYRALASATSDAIFLHESGTVLDVNEAFTEDFGYEPAEASGTDAVGLLAAPESRDDLRRRICSDSSGPHEAVLRRKDGSTFVAEVRCGTIRHRGRPVRVASVRDITERKRAEEAIRRSEARQRFLLGLHERLRPLDDPGAIQYEAARAVGEHLGAHRVGYGEVPEDGETIVIARNYTNGVPDIEGTYRFDDYGPDLLRNFRLGRTFVRTDIARDPSLSEAERAALGALHLGATADVPLLKDGRLVAVLFTHHREPRGWTGEELTLLEAVAELTWNAVVRARAEAALKRSEGRFRAAVDAVSGILWTNNARGEMEGEQPGWSALTGQSYEDYQGFGWSRAVHPEDARPTIDAWGRAVAERRTFVFEHRVRRHDGAWRRFAIRAIPVLREDGEVAEWVGVHTDVTEQRETEEALRRGEAEMRAVFQALTEGVVFLDTEGQVQAANEAVERTFGHSPQELGTRARPGSG
ncbi:MAG: PAS domain S-box protein [Isosphaeraceae bacterium]